MEPVKGQNSCCSSGGKVMHPAPQTPTPQQGFLPRSPSELQRLEGDDWDDRPPVYFRRLLSVEIKETLLCCQKLRGVNEDPADPYWCGIRFGARLRLAALRRLSQAYAKEHGSRFSR